ncbi:hypothetical protein B0J12DRAFT_572670 [Macrophomina phaseolina]|uniref:Transcription factor domain-containing protein n=1 Tax=Macrophomina phaseolina TaxID=35725 RepID=A0ABQ8GBS8_9PEZI|nr:hypothetical protein B0J12DRAFT_572670 [Macrophomina phaseolina]
MWTGRHLEPPRCGPSSWEESNSTFYVRRSTLPDAVACGIATSREAERWFGCFFEGSDRLVPVFSSSDTFASVRERSSLLFDVILTIGCKIHSGSGSLQYQSMHRHLRQRVSTHVLSSLTAHSVENVQALLVLACYWEKSWLFMDLALWMTQELKLPDAVEQMMTRMSGEGSNYLSASEDRALFQMARVCCGVYVLDKIFSLDGGKAAGIASSPSPRRLRCLLSHTAHSAIDFRLLSQVELNSLRTNIHASLTSHIQPPSTTTTAPTPSTLAEHHITTMLRNARLDLSLWLGDWTALSQSALANSSSTSTCVPTTANEHALNILNLRIQHQWALMNAHLKALSALGITSNIAILSDRQRAILLGAKSAAETHMRLLLTPLTAGVEQSHRVAHDRHFEGEAEEHEPSSSSAPYLSHFRWATTFVWAKLAFSVLLTLRLALLVGDPVGRLVELGGEARRVARELRRVVGDGGCGYFGILETSVEKFQMAVGARVRGDADAARGRGPRGDDEGTQAEADFRTYLPKEFSFDWDFPGLNLQYIPLDWEELFGDFDEII